MIAKSRLEEEIAGEAKRLFELFIPVLNKAIEQNSAANDDTLILCLSGQDQPADFHPCEQASKSIVSEIIGVLQADARIDGVILPYAYENLAIIWHGKNRDEFAEKLRAATGIIQKHSFGKTLPERFITMSFGLCSYPFDSNFAYELVERAKIALDAAGNAGGNRVCCYWDLNRES